jgi:hypothetical protein
MLTVLDALIPILLRNVVSDRKLEIKDIRKLIEICPLDNFFHLLIYQIHCPKLLNGQIFALS